MFAGISPGPGILFCTRSDRKWLPSPRPLPSSPTDPAVCLGRACALSVLFFVEGKCGMARVSASRGDPRAAELTVFFHHRSESYRKIRRFRRETRGGFSARSRRTRAAPHGAGCGCGYPSSARPDPLESTVGLRRCGRPNSLVILGAHQPRTGSSLVAPPRGSSAPQTHFGSDVTVEAAASLFGSEGGGVSRRFLWLYLDGAKWTPSLAWLASLLAASVRRQLARFAEAAAPAHVGSVRHPETAIAPLRRSASRKTVDLNSKEKVFLVHRDPLYFNS